MGIREIQEQVRFAVLFNEALWSAVFEIPETDQPQKRPTYPYYYTLSRHKLIQKFPGNLQSDFEKAINIMLGAPHHFCERITADRLKFFLPAFNSMTVAGVLINNIL